MARNEYKGFSTFFDIEDVALRNYNQSRVMANMAEAHIKKPNGDDDKTRQISPGGAALLIGYMNEIPLEERANVFTGFMKTMEERGYAIGA